MGVHRSSLLQVFHNRTLTFLLAVSLAAALLCTRGFADEIMFAGTQGSLAASAAFDLSGDLLTITLMNTSTRDVLAPADVLTGLFFDAKHTLKPVSASLAGSSALYGKIGDAGDGWAYKSGIEAHRMNTGLAAAGFELFGKSSFSSKHNNLQGIDFGLLSEGDLAATGNAGVTKHGPLIQDEVIFTFIAPDGFSLSELGDHVVFQYGSELEEPSFRGDLQKVPTPTPEPGSLLLLGGGLIAVSGLVRRA